jgi:hypothetical protein
MGKKKGRKGGDDDWEDEFNIKEDDAAEEAPVRSRRIAPPELPALARVVRYSRERWSERRTVPQRPPGLPLFGRSAQARIGCAAR